MTTARLLVTMAPVVLLGGLLGVGLASAHTESETKKHPGWRNYDTRHTGFCDDLHCDFRARLRGYTSDNYETFSAQYYKLWDGESDDGLVFGITYIAEERGHNFVRYYQMNCDAMEGMNQTEYVSWSYSDHESPNYGTDMRTYVRSPCPLGAPRGWHRLALEMDH